MTEPKPTTTPDLIAKLRELKAAGQKSFAEFHSVATTYNMIALIDMTAARLEATTATETRLRDRIANDKRTIRARDKTVRFQQDDILKQAQELQEAKAERCRDERELDRLRAEVERHAVRAGEAEENLRIANEQRDGYRAEVERLKARLHRIANWCKAYPRDVFIEPTKEQWRRAAKALKNDARAPSLDAISGSNMRHVVEGIAELAGGEDID